ncbi:c-type cytochrome [Burkholderia sp. BDU5]|uniref:c-type cytochrome n=1 Tax=Burkholderia sp. BDU5 TaxID=1385590 RepID=UPI000753B313|nr:c-type cytochrome [Burkholderia sp. BDU5]KVE45584.1 cytochrome C [Burkholderia sp. BDU5]
MMRRPLIRVCAGIAVVGALAAGYLMWQPAIAPVERPAASAFDPALRQEGARVVALGDCVVCHTANDGRPFAGGRPLATPFGTIFATNITPDPETGIGAWSIDAFARAMRHGVSRDGHLLYPAFPYVHFTRMTDREILAAYAYLMNREPVKATAPANRLMFPLNFRPLVAFWNVLFPRPGTLAADASKTVEWNRGRHLVDGLGHCAACHSPLDAIGGEQSGRAFDGGLVDGWDAPALNRLTGAARPWTRDTLVTYLGTGRSSEHGAAAGPMLPVTRELATLPREDVDAIATYLLSLQKAQTGDAPHAIPVEARSMTEPARRGATIFAASCAQCHGPNAPMQSIGERPSLALSTAVNADTPRNLAQMIIGGITWEGERAVNYMPPFGDVYSDEQIADLAQYVRAAYSSRGPWTGVDATVSTLRKENASR